VPKVVNSSQARSSLYGLLDEAAASHEPVLTTGKRSNGCWYPKRIGERSRRRCFFCLSPKCGVPSAAVWKLPLSRASKAPAGNLAARLYEAGGEGCQETDPGAVSGRKPRSSWLCSPPPSRTRHLLKDWLVIWLARIHAESTFNTAWCIRSSRNRGW